MLKTIRSILLPALIGLGLLAILGLIRFVTGLYRDAAAVHPALGIAALVLAAAGLVLLFIVPLVRVAVLPAALKRPRRTRGPAWNRFVAAYGARLERNRRVREEYEGYAAFRDGGTAREADVQEVLAWLDRRAGEIVTRHAAAAFAATAISQSGRLDTVIVFSTQFRMVKEIAELYYQRPGFRELARLYANVGAAAFLAGELEDSEMLAVLGAPLSAGVAGLIPVGGTDPLVSLLVNSLLDGSTNAFLTLRVGIIARRYCGLRPEKDRSGLARSASLEAAGLLGSVVGRGAKRVGAATRKAMAKSAVAGPKKAAESVVRGTGRAAEGALRGTGRAAHTAAGFGGSVLERIFGLANKVGGKVATLPPKAWDAGRRGTEVTVEFWDGIAGLFRTEAEAGPGAFEAEKRVGGDEGTGDPAT